MLPSTPTLCSRHSSSPHLPLLPLTIPFFPFPSHSSTLSSFCSSLPTSPSLFGSHPSPTSPPLPPLPFPHSFLLLSLPIFTPPLLHQCPLFQFLFLQVLSLKLSHLSHLILPWVILVSVQITSRLSLADNLTLRLSLFTTLLCSGSLPSAIAPHFCCASLLASEKKGGLCPIAICEVSHRLTSKCLASMVLLQAIGIFPPYQMGVGIFNGGGALIHSIKLISSNNDIPFHSKCCLMLDFNNAFNSISRSTLFYAVRSSIPSLSPFCYGSQENLLIGDDTILSCSTFPSSSQSSRRFLWMSQGSSVMAGIWMMALCGPTKDLVAQNIHLLAFPSIAPSLSSRQILPLFSLLLFQMSLLLLMDLSLVL